MTARLFKLCCPLNVVFLVKSRLEFNKNSYLFAVFSSLDKSRNNRRISADTVQGLLDGKNIRIGCRLFDKINHNIKAFIRMMHKSVLFTDSLKNIIITAEFRRRIYGNDWFKAHILTALNVSKF